MRAALVSAVLLAAVCLGAVSVDGGPPPAVEVPARERIAVGGHPGRMALGAGALWVTVYGPNRVVRVDPDLRRVTARIPVRGGPFEIAAGAGAVWVTGNVTRGDDVLHRIDARTRRVDTIALPGRFAGPIAVSRGAVWAIAADHEVTRQWLVRVDPATGAVVGTVRLGAVGRRYVEGLAAGRRFVWLLAPRVGRRSLLPGDVLRFDPRVNRVTARIGARALGMAVGPGGLWVSGCFHCRERRRTDYAQRIDTRALRPVGARIAVPGGAFGPLYAGGEAAWFGGYDSSDAADCVQGRHGLRADRARPAARPLLLLRHDLRCPPAGALGRPRSRWGAAGRPRPPLTSRSPGGRRPGVGQ